MLFCRPPFDCYYDTHEDFCFLSFYPGLLFCFYIRSFQPWIIHSLLFALQSVQSLSLTCAFFNFPNPLHQKQSAGVNPFMFGPPCSVFFSNFVIFRHFLTTIISNQFTMKYSFPIWYSPPSNSLSSSLLCECCCT